MANAIMSAFEVLRAARAAGIELAVDGGALILEAPAPPAAELLERLRRHKTAIVELLQPRADGWSAEDWLAFFNERAAIAEFDGGLPRRRAEAQAFSECVAEWLNRTRAIRVEALPPQLQPCPRCWLAWQREATASMEAAGIPRVFNASRTEAAE
jgi:hypothetical protein